MTTTRIAINGAAGRMGKRLVALAGDDSELELAAALEHDAHSQIGQDSGLLADGRANGVPLSGVLEAPVDAVIDFSQPQGAEAIIRWCHAHMTPLVLATTGLSEATRKAVEAAAAEIPIVSSPNMSLAVNLTLKLAVTAARALRGVSSGVDVEILERHHRFKEDSPSGTALRFGELISEAMGKTRHTHGREGMVGKRPAEEIGYHAIRTGDNPGEHTIIFGLLGETIELRVAASNRDCYALGALLAAKWVAGRPAGLYSMFDVLGLE